jgi:hypothetical protein
MPGGGSFNMDDPAKQEQIRRGPHEYVASEGKHGLYKPVAAVFREFPKMMGKWPKPEYKNFAVQNGVTIPGDIALQNFQAAMIEWDRAMTTSIVNNKAEERQWLQEHGS